MNFSKNLMLKSALVATMTLLGGLLLTSCMSDLEAPQLPPAAYVSIYQGSPDAPALDIFANANRVTNMPLNYSEVLAYSAFYPGNRTFRIAPYNSATSLVEKQFPLEADSVYSFFVVQEGAAVNALLAEDVWTEPATNRIQLRLVNLSPDAGELSLQVGNAAADVVTGVDFKEVTDFKDLPSGNTTLRIKSATGTTLLTSGTLDLRSKRIYTLIVRGKKSETSGDKKLDIQLITNFIY